MAQNQQKRRLLIVEDDKYMARLYQARLSAEGFDIIVAVSGDDCLRKVTKFEPDLILLDLMLPWMDGFTVLEKLKANPQTTGIPVILFTNRSDAEDRSRAEKLGALDFFAKVNTPPEEVIRRIHEALGSKVSRPGLPEHYHLAVDIDALDGKRLVQDLGIPVEYKNGKCSSDVVLDAVIDRSEEEPRIIGRMVVREKSGN
jgi:CheY-like chemotaxis protein